MNEIHEIRKVRRKVFKNPFLREVTYVFNIEATSIFDSKVSELENFVKGFSLKTNQIASDGFKAILATKDGLDILLTSRLLTMRVNIKEYKNYDVFKEFLIPFVLGCTRMLNVEKIDNSIILKRSEFVLQRDNEVAKKMSIKQYCEMLFSPIFLNAYSDKGVQKNARGVKVSAEYTATSNDNALKVELLIGSMMYQAIKDEDLQLELSNANDAIFDMWSYTISKTVKDVLAKEEE